MVCFGTAQQQQSQAGNELLPTVGGTSAAGATAGQPLHLEQAPAGWPLPLKPMQLLYAPLRRCTGAICSQIPVPEPPPAPAACREQQVKHTSTSNTEGIFIRLNNN
jgi:hypothetical protein